MPKLTVLKPETATILEGVINDKNRKTGFVNTNTQKITSRRDHWLKVKSSTSASWDATQTVYTVDVYITPYEATPILEDALMLNGVEGGSVGFPIPVDVFVRPVDFINVDDDWYYVAMFGGGSVPLPQYQGMFLGGVTDGEAGYAYLFAVEVV